MTREDARKEINGRPLTDFIALEYSRKGGANMYICPVCGSGTGNNRHHTGALHISPDKNKVKCYAGNCFTEKGEDTLGALRIIWKCSETEALERAGYTIDKGTPAPAHRERKEGKKIQAEPPADYTSLYREWHEALKNSPEALEYLHGRGITDDSINRFFLGYCAAWKHSKAGEKAKPSKRIIIPRTKGTYTARRIDKPENDFEAAYIKQLQGTQKDLFNLKALEGAETVIICEGELDAISLYQAGASSVVGLGSISNTGTMLEEAKKHPEAVYIIALDNDKDKEDGSNPGKKAQGKLAEDMKAAGLAVINEPSNLFYGDAKDANEALIKNPEYLKGAITLFQETAQAMKAERDEERAAELRKRTGEGMLDNFLSSVTDKEARTFEPIPTGIKDIDRALEGGFIRKTLVTLGAPPAMGKTALAQWIFENIAAAGQDCLYVNLEMSREQLLARSLSRIAWKYNKKDFSALDVLRGYSWTEEQREAITQAAGLYKRDIAPHFIYNPDGVTNNINTILAAMETETARITAQGNPAPLVCIDYLQLIDSGERDAIEGLKGVIFKLKDFAKRRNTVVLLIIANNRASNKSGTVEMESGRDTSAIEYSGDLMLGLAYTAIEDRREYKFTYEGKNGEERDGAEPYTLETIRRLKKEAYEAGEDVPPVCNEISLKVLKNRFGESERRAKLIFDGKHNTFHLSAEGFTEWTYQEKTPFEE